MAPPRLASGLQSLPPILHMTAPSPIPGYSKAPQGLFVLPRVARVFTGTAISPSPPPRQWPSRSTIHAGRNLPDKGLRYLRHCCYSPRVPLPGLGWAGHFCRPLHVAVQIGPSLIPRSARDSGIWSLRIPQGSATPIGPGKRFASGAFPADYPHRTLCHPSGMGSAGYSDFPAYSRILQRP